MENKNFRNIKDLIAEEVDGNILVLEIDDLLEFDKTTGNIKVDKDIFDDFVLNSYIEIQFVEDEHDYTYLYTMISEDDEGIYMESMEII